MADYRVIAEPDDTMVGTVGEDWAIESMAGDIFLLGTNSWRIKRVAADEVRVEDAHGAPPTIPFWLGEAPGRTLELSQEVGRLRRDVVEGFEDVESLMRDAQGRVRPRRPRRGADHRLPARDAGRPRPGADGHGRGVRALLRRVGRHAARRARAVRGADQQGVGPDPAQALLRAVRLRAAGGGQRRLDRAVAGAAAQLPAAGELQLRDVAQRRGVR